MDKLNLTTPNLTQQNLESLAALFPSCITESADKNGNIKKSVNFSVLKRLLGGSVTDDSHEHYEFTWVGKRQAMAEAAKPTTETLRPDMDSSRDWDTTQNLYIEGDNLTVLKILQESYLGKVKMIYIDPPYNTGHDFIYNDHFEMDKQNYEGQIGLFDEEGNKQFDENPISNPRFHSDWCCMIYSRLLLARNLLTDDGLIFISIDDSELGNLKELCDEVFGMSNFIAQITWEKRYTRSNNAKMFASLTDYILLYRKSSTLTLLRESRTDKNDSIYTNPDDDPRGVWTSVSYVNPASREQRPNLCYEITNPFTGEKVSHPTNAWKYEYSTYLQHVKDNKLYWGKNGENSYPRLKKFLSEMEGGIVPANLWYYKDVGTTDAASKDLEKMMGRGIFDFPKSVDLIKKMLDIATQSDSTVLDFFSGSATTAHAVMQLNAEDGGHRKFIMVQLPEECAKDSEAYKAGYKNICEIGKERIRRAGDKIKAEYEAKKTEAEQLSLTDNNFTPNSSLSTLDIGFRVFRVDSSNMKDVYFSPEEISQMMLGETVSNIKEGRTDLDLLYSCLLDWGVEINLPHSSEQVAGCTVHNVDNGALMACFDENVPAAVVEEMAKQKPLKAVFRDSSFATDADKINVTEIFKNLSPDTKVKVI